MSRCCLPVGMITAGLIDRAIDEWELLYGRSTVKNTVAALVLVLDEAVRDGLLVRNPARDRARRRTLGRQTAADGRGSPRDLALPDVDTLNRLVKGVNAAGRHDAYGDTVTILATAALRISEVAGLRVGDVDLQAARSRRAADLPRSRRAGHQVDEGTTQAGSADHRPATPDSGAAEPGAAPGGATGPRATRRRHHHSDPSRRHGLGHPRPRPGPPRPGPARAEAHGAHLDGRRRRRPAPAPTRRRPPGSRRDCGYLHPDTQAVLAAGNAFSSWWSRMVPRASPLPAASRPAGARKRALTCRSRSGPHTVGLTGFEPATP